MITHDPVGGMFALGGDLRLLVRASCGTEYLTYQWYSSDDATPSDDDTPLVGQTSSILEIQGITVDHGFAAGQTYYYYVVVQTGDGLQKAISKPAAMRVINKGAIGTSLVNGDFQNIAGVTIENGGRYTTLVGLPGWQTTHGTHGSKNHIFELQTPNGGGDPMAGGADRVAELGAWYKSSIFQEVATVPGRVYSWSLDHAARNVAGESVAVVIGPAFETKWSGGTSAYPYGESKSGSDGSFFAMIVSQVAAQEVKAVKDLPVGTYSTTYEGGSYYVSVVKANRGGRVFATHTGAYTVPEGQGVTAFGFAAIYSPKDVEGNLLNNIVFSSGHKLDPGDDVAYDGGGQLSVDAQKGYAYGVVEVRGSTTMPVSNMSVELDGVELSAANLGEGTSDWYTPDAAGELVFGNLSPGKTYRMVGVPTAAVNTGLSTNLSPGLVLDDGYYSQATIKAVADSSDGDGGNIQAMSQATEGGKARIIVKPAREDVEYALLETSADGSMATDVVAAAWRLPEAGTGVLNFDGLERGRTYAIVARAKGYLEVSYASQVAAGAAVLAATPSAAFLDVTENDGSVTRAVDSPGTITVSNKGTIRQSYLVFDATTGAGVAPGWIDIEPGKSADFAVDENTTYQVVAKEAGVSHAAPSPGLRSYPAAPEPEIDYVNETVGKDGVVPVTVEYRLQDKDTGVWLSGGDADWTAGTGGSALSLSGYLDGTKPGGAGLELTYRMRADFEPSIHVERSLTVPARPDVPTLGDSGYGFDYEQEELIPGAGISASVQARVSSTGSWMEASTATGLDLAKLGWTGAERGFQARLEASGSSFASAANEFASIPSRPAAPSVGVIVDEHNADIYHFTAGIDGDDVDKSEYRLYGSADAWAACDGASVGKGRTYEVRAKATDHSFVSENLLLASSEAQLKATVTEPFDTIAFGYADVPTATITLSNPGKAAAAVAAFDDVDTPAMVVLTAHPDAYTSADAPFVVTQGSAAVIDPRGGTTPGAVEETAWTVKAKADLPAGVYQASVTVPYRDGSGGGDVSVYFTALATVSLVVEKAVPPVPEGLAVSVTDKTATLSAVNADVHALDLQYSLNKAFGYQDDATVTGLSPATLYDFHVRTKADDNHDASPAASIAAYTAFAAPEPSALKIDYAQETASFDAVYEASSTPDGSSPISSGDSITSSIGGTVYLRHKSQGTFSDPAYIPESAWTACAVADRPSAALKDATASNASDSATADGSISLASTFEIKVGDAWIPYAGGGTASGLRSGSYEVRAPATGSAFGGVSGVVGVGVDNYLVTFDPAGGSWQPSAAPAALRVKADGSSTIGSANMPADPAWEGHTLLSGWYAGAGAAIAWDFDADPVTQDTELSVRWTAHQFNVVFHPGVDMGAVPAVSGTMANQSFTYAVAQNLFACGFSRPNYEFKGWATSQGGPVVYTDEEEMSTKISDDGVTVDLYAVWARPVIAATIPVAATVSVNPTGEFTCPSADAYRIENKTDAALKVVSVGCALDAGASNILEGPERVGISVNGVALAAGASTSVSGDDFVIAAGSPAAPGFLPLRLSLAYPEGASMIYAEDARPFATLSYTIDFDDTKG